jgi:hypothetical protein
MRNRKGSRRFGRPSQEPRAGTRRFATRLKVEAMPEQRIDIGVVTARRTLRSAWADHVWQAHAVLPAAPPLAPGTALGGGLFYAGPRELVIHGGATAHYRDNLNGGRPSLWIALTPVNAATCHVSAVTADPYEGEALTEAIGAVVDQVPMPDPIRAEIAAFVAAFHIERPFLKRERDRADLELGRGRPWRDE